MKFKLPNNLVVLDLETTGPDFREYSLCQLGAVIVDKELNLIQEFKSYVRPSTDKRDEFGMSLHQIPEEVLQKAPSFKEVSQDFEDFCKGYDVNTASWGSSFDTNFLQEEYRRIGRKYPFHYRHLDFKSVVTWELSKRGEGFWGGSPGKGLENTLKKYGLEFEGDPHEALWDVKNVIRLMRKSAFGERFFIG